MIAKEKQKIGKDYQIEVVIPKKRKRDFLLGQRYHWRIRALNGKLIQSGEKQHNLNDVKETAERFGLATGLTVVVVTE